MINDIPAGTVNSITFFYSVAVDDITKEGLSNSTEPLLGRSYDSYLAGEYPLNNSWLI
jgi:hypothetical protein